MFFSALGKFTVKFRWAVLVFWILLAALIVWRAPVLSKVASTDQESFFPADADAVRYSKLVKQLYPDKGTGSTVIFVFHRKGGLSASDRKYGQNLEKWLSDNKEEYKVKSINSPYTKKELEQTMISKDGEAALLSVDLTVSGFIDTTNTIIRNLRNDIHNGNTPAIPQGLTVNITGDAAIGQEEVDNVHSSMELTTKITILLVVVILILIYRSPVAPLLPLATIGLSFLISRGVIAALTSLNLKVSSFTETFLIAVLFGAGTDYCLLLVSRYREEIVSGKAHKEALLAAFPPTGTAIVCSGGTVIIGFFFMIMAKFGLFSTTGPSIAIGVGITIISVLTLTPAMLSILGERIFWPAHPSRNLEKERMGSPFWNRLAAFVTTKPVRIIIFSLIIMIPFMLCTLKIQRSFDQLGELPDKSDTVAGFENIKAHFEQGEMLPVKLVLSTDKDLWSEESLQAIDAVAAGILKVDGVSKVRTATRPLGEQLNEISIPRQISMLTGGLEKAGEGLSPLIDGIGKAQGGVSAVSEGLMSGSEGLNTLSGKTGEAASGVSQIRNGMGKLSVGQESAIAALKQVKAGIDSISAGLGKTAGGIDTAGASLKDAVGRMEALMKQQPELAKNENFLVAYNVLKGVAASLPQVTGALTESRTGLTTVGGGIDKAAAGIGTVKTGVDKSSKALGQVVSGMEQIAESQKTAGDSLNTASATLKQIAEGLQPAKEGLDEMKAGLASAQTSADKYSSDGKGLNGIFYLPPGALGTYPQLKEAMKNYISENGKGVTFNIILSVPPYSPEALNTKADIENAVRFTLKGTALEKAEFHLSGASSISSELSQMTAEDFAKVMIFVLLGIFIVLVLLLRSFTAPIYLILTILLSFATTMGISYLAFQVILGNEGLSWSVPFFSFCILVALGVDYNIFLMTRVKEEYKPGDTARGTAIALSSTGKIITSCGIIMAGTFGAMLFSPVTQLVQIGFTTVAGLLLDTFIIRCLLVPAIAVKLGELNWWPGRKLKVVAAGTEKTLGKAADM